jgi:hypothetical protein
MRNETFCTVSFDECGRRGDAQGLPCNERSRDADSITASTANLSLEDGREGLEGAVSHGWFLWRCFAGYAERTKDHDGHRGGIMGLIVHQRDRRKLLLATTHGPVPEETVSMLTSEFLDRAVMEQIITDGEAGAIRDGVAKGLMK